MHNVQRFKGADPPDVACLYRRSRCFFFCVEVLGFQKLGHIVVVVVDDDGDVVVVVDEDDDDDVVVLSSPLCW